MHSEITANIDYSGEENENELENNYASDFEINNSSITRIMAK